MRNRFYTTLTFLLLSIYSYAQNYSSYYISANVNSRVDANINHNVSGVVYENKTITNIDYGALALANAQKEKNRIELMKINNEKEKTIAIEIAENPLKSYDYGYSNTFNVEKKDAKNFGFKRFSMSYIVPNKILFNQAGEGRFENVSNEGIVTEIIINPPSYNKEKKEIDLEKELTNDGIQVGKETEMPDSNNKMRLAFLHKKDLNRATIYGIKGYKKTFIWEDKFEYGITDNYVSYNSNVGNGYTNFVKVRIYCDKDNVTFEQLEGRRYYFTRLIEKIISTAGVFNEKY
jgi:hypothetical protein